MVQEEEKEIWDFKSPVLLLYCIPSDGLPPAPLSARQRQFRGKYVKQNVGDLLRSLSSRRLATSPVGEIHPGIPARERLSYIHAGFTRDIFVLKSRISHPPPASVTLPFSYTLPAAVALPPSSSCSSSLPRLVYL